MTHRTPRLLAALLAGVLVLGACGGDDDAADDADDTTTTTETSAPDPDEGTDEGTDDDPDGADDGGDATDDGADGTDDGAGGTDGGSTGGETFDPAILAGIDDFCDLDEIGDEAFDALFGGVDAGPAEREQAIDALGAFYLRAIELAPGEIKPDLQLMLSQLEPFFSLLADYDYDMMALFAAAETDPALQERVSQLESPELDAAGERVDDWVEANCDW